MPDAETGMVPEGWWDGQFTRRRRLTLADGVSAEALADQPVLVSLPVELGAEPRELRFVAAEGTPLNHEIDAWTESAHTVWVRMPAAGAEVTMYYGAADAESLPAEHAQGVWGDHFAGVWHFAGDARDSTRHAYDGEPQRASFEAGKIGQALTLDRDVEAHVRLANDIAFVAGAGGATVSAWVKHAGGGSGDQEIILGVGTDSADGHLSRISIALSPELGLIGEINPDQAGWELTESAAGSVGEDSWRHVAVVMSVVDRSIALYVDGTLMQEPYQGSWGADQFPSSPSNRVVVGGEEDASKSFFNGSIDELRVETTAQSGAWVANAMRAGSGEVLSVGSEEAI